MKGAVVHPEALYLALLSGGFTLLPLFVPLGGSFLALLAPFPLLALAVKYPWPYAAGVVGLEGGLILLDGRLQPLALLGQYALMAWVMGWAVRRRWSLSQTLLASVLVPLGVGGLLLVAASLAAHAPLSSFVTHYVEQMVSLAQEYVRTLEQFQDGDEEQVAALLEALPHLVWTMLPALVALGHLGMNLLNYLLLRRYCQRSQPPQWLDPADVTCWRASDYLVWVFVASGAAVLAPWDVVSVIGVNLLISTLAIYLLQGLAIAVFWSRRLPLPLAGQAVVLIVLFLVAGPFCLLLCTVAGLFDLWVDFRRQRQRPGLS